MSGLLAFVGATVVGGIGWWLGSFVGFTTAMILSAVGTGVGIYYGRKIAREYLS